MKLIVIAVAYDRTIWLRSMVDSWLLQTRQDWELHIIYDGPSPQKVKDIMSIYDDPRIRFYESPERYGRYGHPNRRAMLQAVQCDPKDFILMTNDDNFYVCKFWEFMGGAIKSNTGIVYCDTVHSHFNYDINRSELRENGIDMGAFIVRAEIAKSTGFNHDHFSADGTYAEECARNCHNRGASIVKINKALFIHN